MDIELRLEQPSDYRETENVTREAFWNHHSPDCNEHYLLHIMRDCPSFVPELDIVAVCNGKIVGNVVCVKSLIKTDDGNEYEVLCLGPISVLPEYQSKGIGARMIERIKQIAGKIGFHAILLYGDPLYYSRLGFIAAESFGIRTANNMYAAALQVFELHKNALSDIRGRFFENEIYEVDEAAAEFDGDFPIKEIVSGTPSQKRFLEVFAMRSKTE